MSRINKYVKVKIACHNLWFCNFSYHVRFILVILTMPSFKLDQMGALIFLKQVTKWITN